MAGLSLGVLNLSIVIPQVLALSSFFIFFNLKYGIQYVDS